VQNLPSGYLKEFGFISGLLAESEVERKYWPDYREEN
jgi:hypothetical protein